MMYSLTFTGYDLHSYKRAIPPPMIARIQEEVADYYRIPRREMKSARRFREVARPRQVAMFLARELTNRSLPVIGKRFGGRDHTTVMWAIRRVEELCASDAELSRDVDVLRARLAA